MSWMNTQDPNTAASNPPQQVQGTHSAGGGGTHAPGAQPMAPQSPALPTTATDGDSSSADDRQCGECGRRFSRPSAVETHMNTHTGAKPHACGAPGCKAAFAARSNMLRHRRMHGEAIAAALDQQDKKQAAARPPPPAVFHPPIVSHQVGEGSTGSMNVQWMIPNRVTRPYKRYPDIPRTAEDAAAPTAPAMPSWGASYTATTWQPTAPSEVAQTSTYDDGQTDVVEEYHQL